MPKKSGVILISLGAVLILAALLLFLHNRGEDRSAGQEAETLLEEARSVIADNSAQPDAPVRSTTVTGIVAGIISRLAARTSSTQCPVLSAVSIPSSATVTIDGSLDETRSAAPGRSSTSKWSCTGTPLRTISVTNAAPSSVMRARARAAG